MFAWTLNLFRAIGYRFHSSADGSVVITFALTLIPLVGAIGTAVDYSRANAFKVPRLRCAVRNPHIIILHFSDFLS